MDCPGDWPTSHPPKYIESSHWFKNPHGWCKQQIRSYQGGDQQREYLEWGLSDNEYFKRKLAGTT